MTKEIQVTTGNKAQNMLSDSLFSKELSNHYMELAEKLCSSALVPKNYQNKPQDLFICWAMGYQIGMSPEQSMNCIAVINGRPTLWGDDMLALCMAHKDFEDITEEPIMNGSVITGYTCTIYRKNKTAHTSIFTLDMARRAGLLSKSGPWSQYPERMLMLRARGFALRDRFPDALKGIKSREEVEDYIDGEIVPTESRATASTRAEQLKNHLKNKKGETYDKASDINEDTSSQNINEQASCETQESINDERISGNTRTDSGNSSPNNDSSPATEEQIDLISSMLLESPDEERKQKAFNYFEIKDLSELDKSKAERFIKLLEKSRK